MMSILRSQRDQAAEAFLGAAGELAAWRVRWDDINSLRARLAELGE